MEKTTQRITITLPIEVYNKIKESAIRDVRTIGEEITYLLQLHVPSYAPQPSQFDNFKRTTPTPTLENPTGQTHTPTNNIYYKKTIID